MNPDTKCVRFPARSASYSSADWTRACFNMRRERNSMARVTNDLRFALRQILRSPGFAITAIVTLALAIGANTAIFTLLNQALLRALPVKDPSQLVVLSFSGSAPGHLNSEGGDSPGHRHYFSYPMYRDLRDK